MLEQCCNNSQQCCNNVATLSCLAENHRCESSRKASANVACKYILKNNLSFRPSMGGRAPLSPLPAEKSDT